MKCIGMDMRCKLSKHPACTTQIITCDLGTICLWEASLMHKEPRAFTWNASNNSRSVVSVFTQNPDLFQARLILMWTAVGWRKVKMGAHLPTTAVHISVIHALICVSSAWNIQVLGKNRHHSLRNVKHFPSPSDQCFQVDRKHLSAFYMRSEVADSLYICEKKCSNIINCVWHCPEFPFCVLVVTCAVCFIKKV